MKSLVAIVSVLHSVIWIHRYFAQLEASGTALDELTSANKSVIFQNIYCPLKFYKNNDEKYFSYRFFLDLLDGVLTDGASTGTIQSFVNAKGGETLPVTIAWWEDGIIAGDIDKTEWHRDDGVCNALISGNYGATDSWVRPARQ